MANFGFGEESVVKVTGNTPEGRKALKEEVRKEIEKVEALIAKLDTFRAGEKATIDLLDKLIFTNRYSRNQLSNFLDDEIRKSLGKISTRLGQVIADINSILPEYHPAKKGKMGGRDLATLRGDLNVIKNEITRGERMLTKQEDAVAATKLIQSAFEPAEADLAIRAAYHKGFLTSGEIALRIEISKRDGTKLQYFFDDDTLSGFHLPRLDGEIRSAGKELGDVRAVAHELSQQSHKALYVIYNARGGLLYEYGMDPLETQLALQFAAIAKKKRTTARKLLSQFKADLEKSPHWPTSSAEGQKSEQRAYLEVGQAWIDQGKLSYLLVPETGTKVGSSSQVDISTEAKLILKTKIPFLFVDVSTGVEPNSFNRLKQTLASDPRIQRNIKTLPNGFADSHTASTAHDAVCKLLAQGAIDGVAFNGNSGSNGWWDDRPELLGAPGKRFSADNKDENHTTSGEYLIRKVGSKQVEFLSFKIRMATRCRDIDSFGRNWYERQYLAGAIQKGERWAKPHVTGARIRRRSEFRKSVPYKTHWWNDKPSFDWQGYPQPTETTVSEPMGINASRNALKKKRETVRRMLDDQDQKLDTAERRSKFRVTIFGGSKRNSILEQRARAVVDTLVGKNGFKIATGANLSGVPKAAMREAAKIARKVKGKGGPDLAPEGIALGEETIFEGVETTTDRETRTNRLIDESQAIVFLDGKEGTHAELIAAVARAGNRPIIIWEKRKKHYKYLREQWKRWRYSYSSDNNPTLEHIYRARSEKDVQKIVEAYYQKSFRRHYSLGNQSILGKRSLLEKLRGEDWW